MRDAVSFEPETEKPCSRLGGWVLIVGPSGAGKDTLMAITRGAVVDQPRIKFARRVVTRPPSRFEDHDTLSEKEFGLREVAGEFALSWQAHGLSYAVASSWLSRVAAGDLVVANVSRTILPEACECLCNVNVVLVTAPSDVCAVRIAARGRERGVHERLRRGLDSTARRYADLVINNIGSPEIGAGQLTSFLRSL
ncbi:MAG: phosphonate metabolism protein/1,5-bisphosphokinase (PRPP-forming) PhnN [Hyphomicrobiaceae bacterium]